MLLKGAHCNDSQKEVFGLRNSSESSIGCVGQTGISDMLLASLPFILQLDLYSCE